MSSQVPEVLVARCHYTSSLPRKQVFSLEAVGRLPVVTGLRALEAIRMRDSLRGFRLNLFGNEVVVRPEGLPGPLSLCRPLGRYDTWGVELVPRELSCL